MERFWPKRAGISPQRSLNGLPRKGVHFNYGDLDDLVNLLAKDPGTRQAYLPVWFPEDTGAVEGQRVPCTIGYLFTIHQGFLHITYYIRSCDLFRHFNDDVYLAMKLAYWIVDKLNTNIAISSEWGQIWPLAVKNLGQDFAYLANAPEDFLWN
jgi:hypothetical protein